MPHSVVCTFLNEKGVREKICSIFYGLLGSNCSSFSQASQSFSDTVTIGLPLAEDEEREYCFTVTARNGTFTTILKGMFKTGLSCE